MENIHPIASLASATEVSFDIQQPQNTDTIYADFYHEGSTGKENYVQGIYHTRSTHIENEGTDEEIEVTVKTPIAGGSFRRTITHQEADAIFQAVAYTGSSYSELKKLLIQTGGKNILQSEQRFGVSSWNIV